MIAFEMRIDSVRKNAANPKLGRVQSQDLCCL